LHPERPVDPTPTIAVIFDALTDFLVLGQPIGRQPLGEVEAVFLCPVQFESPGFLGHDIPSET